MNGKILRRLPAALLILYMAALAAWKESGGLAARSPASISSSAPIGWGRIEGICAGAVKETKTGERMALQALSWNGHSWKALVLAELPPRPPRSWPRPGQRLILEGLLRPALPQQAA